MRVKTKFIEAPLEVKGYRIEITTETDYKKWPTYERKWKLTLGEAKQVRDALTKIIQKAEVDK